MYIGMRLQCCLYLDLCRYSATTARKQIPKDKDIKRYISGKLLSLVWVRSGRRHDWRTTHLDIVKHWLLWYGYKYVKLEIKIAQTVVNYFAVSNKVNHPIVWKYFMPVTAGSKTHCEVNFQLWVSDSVNTNSINIYTSLDKSVL